MDSRMRNSESGMRKDRLGLNSAFRLPHSALRRYMHWLHTQWPAGHVERLPEVDAVGRTNVPGVYVIGDLKGVPLLKFAIDSGVKAVREIKNEFKHSPSPGPSARKGEGVVYDLLILGGGVSGMAAAKEAKAQGLSF